MRTKGQDHTASAWRVRLLDGSDTIAVVYVAAEVPAQIIRLETGALFVLVRVTRGRNADYQRVDDDLVWDLDRGDGS